AAAVAATAGSQLNALAGVETTRLVAPVYTDTSTWLWGLLQNTPHSHHGVFQSDEIRRQYSQLGEHYDAPMDSTVIFEFTGFAEAGIITEAPAEEVARDTARELEQLGAEDELKAPVSPTAMADVASPVVSPTPATPSAVVTDATKVAIPGVTDVGSSGVQPSSSLQSDIVLCAAFRASPLHVALTKRIRSARDAPNVHAFWRTHRTYQSKFAANIVSQFALVWQRMAVEWWRNMGFTFARIFIGLFLTLFLGLLYYQLDDSDFKGVTGLASLSFAVTVFAALFNLSMGMAQFMSRRPTVYREMESGYYLSFAYGSSIMFVEAFMCALLATMWMYIPFSMADKLDGRSRETLTYQWTAQWMTLISYVFLPFAYSALAPIPGIATLLQAVTMGMSTLMAGMFVPAPLMPAGWLWLHKALPVSWGLKTVLASVLYCDATVQTCKTVLAPVNGVNIPLTPYRFLSARFGLDWFARNDNLWHLAVIIAAYHVVAHLMTHFAHWGRRRA
ncbi:MAG: ABC transporter permease, partial [Methanosarcinales archaeon]